MEVEDELEDADVYIAYESNEAFKILEENSIDSIVTDLNLNSDSNGLDLIQCLLEKNETAKCFLISGMFAIDSRYKELENSYTKIQKPFSMLGLIQMLGQS